MHDHAKVMLDFFQKMSLVGEKNIITTQGS